MTRIDLHTHSIASPDGRISEKQYTEAIDSGKLDVIAITDHNRIDYAVMMRKKHGDKIIVGEEIMTSEGEIIGLYLTKKVEPGLSLAETIIAIRSQGGITYLPHPFETVRHGIMHSSLENLENQIDIVETYNGRTLQNKGDYAKDWAGTNDKPGAGSSDAHSKNGLSYTYTVIPKIPTKNTLLPLLRSGKIISAKPPVKTYFDPKRNRIGKKLGIIKDNVA